MKSNNTTFKAVELFGRNFIVASDGRAWVKYLYKKANNWKAFGEKAWASNNGYHYGMVKGDDHKYHPVMLHRLVAMAFVSNPDNYNEVDHIDGNPSNNLPSNIRWCTRSDNNKNRAKYGVAHRSNKHVLVLCVETGTIYNGIVDAAQKTGIEQSLICRCCKGKSKQTHGLHFQYVQ